MADWRLETKTAEITRYNGGWGNPFSKKTVAEALAWFSKHGYKAAKARDLKSKDADTVIGRQVDYRKAGCKTEYTMTIRF